MRIRPLLLLNLGVLAALLLGACVPLNLPDGTPRPTRTPRTSAQQTAVPAIVTPTLTPLPYSDLGVEASSLAGLRLTLWHALSGESALALAHGASLFNTVNEWDIIVDVSALGDAQSLQEALDAALQDGLPPDVLVALPESILHWDDANGVLNLTPYWQDGIYGLEKGVEADLPAVFWETEQRSGRRLGVPAERSAGYLFYNLTWAAELGFETPPATSGELRTQLCAANAAFRADDDLQNDGYGGWILDPDWMAIYPWMLAFGGDVHDASGYRFETPQNLAALEYLQALQADNCAWMTVDPANPYALDPEPHYEQFARRLALVISGNLNEVSALQSVMTRLGAQDEWTLIPYPGSAGSAVVAYGPSYALTRTSPERQLAGWLFIRWMLSAENQAEWVTRTGTLPLRTSTAGLLAGYGTAHPQWAAAVQSLETAHAAPQSASWSLARYILEDGTRSIFRLGLPQGSIPEVLAEMDRTVRELSGGE